MTVVLGNFLEVYTGSSACGLGKLSDISDSDCKELKGCFFSHKRSAAQTLQQAPEAGVRPCFNGTVFLKDVRIGQKVLPRKSYICLFFFFF